MNKIISPKSSFFYNVLDDYKRTSSFNSSRIKQDLTKEVSTKSDYHGREIFELLQNAEDEKSDFVEIHLDSSKNLLSISNGGVKCTPFTEEGFCSIMMAEMSPKLLSKQTYIGYKGLGFRSLLNWADEIRIYSSGVCCTFSTKIAKKYWEEDIKCHLSPENVEQHERFAKERLGLSYPMSILAIPQVEEDLDKEKNYTTKIEVIFKKECESSIIEQIRSLTGKVLLFLTNIQSIKIDLNGEKSSIEKEKTGENTVRVKDSFNPDGVEYTLYKDSGMCDVEINKCYEVCIAYDKKNHEKGNFIYTFFPTKVRIGLPCVIHATFDLNSSRNSLNETAANNWMQQKIASCLSKFACKLSKQSEQLSWEYLELINLNTFDQKDFPLLYEKLQKRKKELPIYPTLRKGYCRLSETVRFSEEIAKYKTTVGFLFDNHLKEGYTHYDEIVNMTANDDFVDRINDYSRSLYDSSLSQTTIQTRTELIYAVSTVNIQSTKKLCLLLDNKGNLIENDGKINVGEDIDYLPRSMQISYVSEELITALIDKFEIEESNVKRGLTRRLKKCGIDVSDMDLNAAKKRIVSYSKNEMDEEGFIQLMYALYHKIQTTDSSGLDSLFEDSDFQILAKDGSKHYPSEVVISSDGIYNNNQVLYLLIDDWVEKFVEHNKTDDANGINISIDRNSIEDFFYNTVGVSHRVPMVYTRLDDQSHSYLDKYSTTLRKSINGYWYYYSTTIEEKHEGFFNRYRIIDKSFIEQLVNKGKTLSDIIGLIMSDPRAMHELKNKTLHFQQRTIKSEEVEVSYPLYKLRSYPQFEPLSMFVVEENIILNGNVDLEQELAKLSKELDTKQMLLLLGARSSMADLSLEELYNILEMLPKRNLKRGIQKLYKSIREAINTKRTEQNFKELSANFSQNGQAYARKDGGELEIMPVKEIYYWDNEQLPHNILCTKYKLELPNRVGEDSVKAIFGVKLAKEIHIKIENHDDNNILSDEVKDRIFFRIRYLLAYRLQNSREINDYKERVSIANSLRNIKINVYTSCRLSIDNTTVELNEGEMVSTRNGNNTTFHVCTSLTDVDSAFKTPSFSENITEAVCITLKVTSNEMANCFRSILKNSMEENEFIGKKEISHDIWEDVDKALGLSEQEKKFWNSISQRTDVPLTLDKLTSSYNEKTSYLKEIFPNIEIPENYTEVSDMTPEEQYYLLLSLSNHYNVNTAEDLGEEGLSKYYTWWVHNKVMILKDSFSHNIYNYVKQHVSDGELEDPPKWYYEECLEFSDGKWFLEVIDKNKHKILSDSELENLFNTKFEESFSNISQLSCDDHWQVETLETYNNMLDKVHLTRANLLQSELVYTYFMGYEDKFQSILDKYTVSSFSDVEKNNTIDVNTLDFSFGIGFNKSINKDGNVKSSSKKKGTRYSSEREKQRAGLLAEQKVFRYLCNSKDLFTDVTGCSRNLDPINGNDALHYDIMYSIIEGGSKGHCRYLEVKSMSGDSIIMTNQEYKFAIDHKKYYDFALVNGNSITILRSPFLPNESGSILQAIPETYKLTIDIKKEE